MHSNAATFFCLAFSAENVISGQSHMIDESAEFQRYSGGITSVLNYTRIQSIFDRLLLNKS